MRDIALFVAPRKTDCVIGPARRSGIRRGGRPGSAIRVDAADVADFQQRFDQVDSESP
jgi:hypothetical protein